MSTSHIECMLYTKYGNHFRLWKLKYVVQEDFAIFHWTIDVSRYNLDKCTAESVIFNSVTEMKYKIQTVNFS